MQKPFDIVCIFAHPWSWRAHRSHQLMARLALNHRILYVEPPADISRLFKDWRRLKRTFQPSKISSNFFLWSPLVFISMRRLPILQKINLLFIRLLIKRIIKKLRFKDYILWTQSPRGSEYFLGKLNEKLAIYDCTDEHSALASSPKIKRTVIESERKLLTKVDLVFVLSQGLYRSKRKFNSQTYLVPDGADLNLFNTSTYLEPPADISGITHPIIGYIGGIASWIDLALVYYIAIKRPQWSIVMVGSISADISKFKTLNNVHFLGPKDYLELPSYVSQFDVGIIPYKLNELTINSDPLKSYIYLAAGKPVVAADLPAMHRFDGIIKIAQTSAQFLQHIEDTIKSNSYHQIDERRTIAQANSWEQRVKIIEEVINRHLRQQNCLATRPKRKTAPIHKL